MADAMSGTASSDAPSIEDGRSCLTDDAGDVRRRCFSDGSGHSPRGGGRRHVTFTSVRIREYSTILGDHPCCPSGPPLSLGWTMEREIHAEFEAYENERMPRRVRSKQELRLDGEERRVILSSLVVGGVVADDSPPTSRDVFGGRMGWDER